jgi:hypothetical protein
MSSSQAEAWKRPATAPRRPREASRPVKPFKEKAKAKPSSSWSAQQQTTILRPDTHYNGPIPDRELLFGHYLYYSGLVNWQTIAKALVWQRTRRPRIGELGCNYGWLSNKDILHILKSRALTDAFGKSAVLQGFLTPNQLRLLLFQQKRLQKKFGDYFIANNLLSESQVNLLVQQFRNHNYAVGAKKPRYGTM